MKRWLQIFRDGKGQTCYLKEPLKEGEQGNLQTLAVMAKIVNEDRIQPDLRLFVLREIVGKVRGHDVIGEADAVFEFARDRITYRRDPVGVERVADVWSTLYALNPIEPEGDCGIKSLFLATCLATIGHRPVFVVVKQRREQRAFNHVYVGNVIGPNEIRYYDPTPQDALPGSEIKSEVKYLYPIFT
jgi:hypothetical protein